MANWIDIGEESQFSVGSKTCVKADTYPIVMCNLDGELCAFINVCPHAGLPLGEGDLTGKVITCPFHGYAYDVTSGRNVDFPDDVPLRRFPVKCEGGHVFVDVDKEAADE